MERGRAVVMLGTANADRYRDIYREFPDLPFRFWFVDFRPASWVVQPEDESPFFAGQSPVTSDCWPVYPLLQ